MLLQMERKMVPCTMAIARVHPVLLLEVLWKVGALELISVKVARVVAVVHLIQETIVKLRMVVAWMIERF